MLKKLAIAFALHTSLMSTASAENDISLLSMWETPGERLALYQIIDHAVQSGLSWSNLFASHNFNGTRAEFTRLLIINNPPDLVQWIAASELERLVKNDLLHAIPYNFTNPRIKYRPEVIEAIRHDENSINSLPIGIHIKNHLLINASAWRSAGVSIPKTADEFFKALPLLKKSGVVPVAVSDEKWQIRNLMMTLLSSYMSEEAFEAMLQTHVRMTIEHRHAFRKSFSNLRMMFEMANKDYKDMRWNEVTYKVESGEAASQITGDNVGSEILGDEDLICMMFPGSRFLLWEADVFAVLNHDGLSQQEFQKVQNVLMTQETHEHFIKQKSGIPAIENIDTEMLSTCTKQSLADWENYKDRKVWLDGDDIRTTLERIGSIAKEFITDPNMGVDDAVERLVRNLELEH